MTLEETGAYIKLLCFQADKGILKEEEILRKIPKSIWCAICCKFEKEVDGFYNRRLREEMEKRYKFVEHQKENANMRWHKSGIAKAMPLDNDNDNDNANANANGVSKEVVKEKRKGMGEGQAIEILADLNDVLKTSYSLKSKKNIELIQARLNEGFTVADFKIVHRKMAQAWGLDNKMRQYLRPITLYSNKFESYLNRPEDIANMTPQQQANMKALAKFNEEIKDDNRSVQPGICGIK